MRYQKRRARRQKKNTRPTSAPKWIYRIAAVLLACVLVLLIVFGIRSCSTEKVQQWFQDTTVGSQVGDGFPADIVGSTVSSGNFLTMDRDLIMVSDTALVRMNATAKTILNRQHSYGRPMLSVGGKNILIYNLGSTDFSIETESKTKLKTHAENNIMTADIASNGRYALVTDSKGYPSQLTVYLENDTVQYEYNFAEVYVTGVALNYDGTRAAVSAVSAQDGALISLVYLFDFGQEEPVAILSYADTLLLSLEYFNSGKVIAVGDQMASVIDAGNGQKVDYSYESRKLAAYSLDNGQAALALEPYDTTSTSKLVVLDQNGEAHASTDLTERMSAVSLRGDTAAVLCGSQVKAYSVNALRNRDSAQTTAEPMKVLDAGTDAKSIALGDESSVYVLGISQIRHLHF